jgi:hypothetical protein
MRTRPRPVTLVIVGTSIQRERSGKEVSCGCVGILQERVGWCERGDNNKL